MKNDARWAAIAAGDPVVRDEILRENLAFVYHVVGEFRRKLPKEVNYEELVSAGTLGLIHAIEKFDSSRGLSFSTFAIPRVRGAILDELRRQDHVPRSVRRKIREMETARQIFLRETGRLPTDEEMARRLGIKLSTLWKWETDVEGVKFIPLYRREDEGAEDESSPLPAVLANICTVDIEDEISDADTRLILGQALSKLSPRELRVLELYYWQEYSQLRIGEELDVTKERVSQIRRKAIKQLREYVIPLLS